MPCRQSSSFYSNCCSFLVKNAQTNGHDAVTTYFNFFLCRIAERKRDVAKEKGLVFQLPRFQKQLKPLLQQMHF